MLPKLCIVYLEQGVFTKRIVLYKLIKLVYQYTNSYKSTKLIIRVSLKIIWKRGYLQLHVYNLINLKSSIPEFSVTLELGLYKILLQHQISHCSSRDLAYQPSVNQFIINKVIWVFVDKNYHKTISSNNKWLTVSIFGFMISKVFVFILSQKT